MKRINIVLIMLVVLSGLFVIPSCTEEHGSYTEYGSFTDPVLVAPADAVYLDETTSVDLTWQSTDSDGDPQNWIVYFGDTDDPKPIETGYTQQTISVSVTKGNKYFWKVEAMDANGVITRSPMWSFSIIDPDAPLKMNMTWTTNVLSAVGLDVDPEDAVDLRLIIVPEAKADKIIVDGSGFESYEAFNELADGTYLIEVDAFSTIDAGDFDASLDISISLAFNQKGILSQTLDFPKVMTNDFTCDSYYTVLAKLTKTGSVYEIESAPQAQWTAEPTSLIGDWSGTDNWGYDETVTISADGDGVSIYGLGFEWMVDWWAENVISGNPVHLDFDFSTLGSISIEDQYYITTDWDDSEYNIVGTAMLNLCGDTPTLTVTYDLAYTADGWSIGGYYRELFTIELTPVTSKGSKGTEITPSINNTWRSPKPIR